MADFKKEFPELRKKLAACLQELLKDGYGKSYEGTWEIVRRYRNVYDDEGGELPPIAYSIKLDCYLIGPTRHYEWNGKTLDEAFGKCKRDVEQWIDECWDDSSHPFADDVMMG